MSLFLSLLRASRFSLSSQFESLPQKLLVNVLDWRAFVSIIEPALAGCLHIRKELIGIKLILQHLRVINPVTFTSTNLSDLTFDKNWL